MQESKVLTPAIILPDNLTINYLIDEATGTWNESLVQECFDPTHVEQILQIPLGNISCEDFPAWSYTRNGIYSVRSAYNFARMERFHNDLSANGKGECSDPTEVKKM